MVGEGVARVVLLVLAAAMGCSSSGEGGPRSADQSQLVGRDGSSGNVAAVVWAMRGRFRACYQQELGRNRTAAGSVILVVKLDAAGRMVAVEPGPTVLSVDLLGCLSQVVATGGFSPPPGGSAVISIPITFVNQGPPRPSSGR